MTVAEVNTVYKATTTKAIQDRGKWPRRFILIAAVLLVILGTVIIALSTLVCDAGLDAESSLDGSNNNSKINSTGVVEVGEDEGQKESVDDDDDDDGIEWRILATGVVFLTAGLIIFILYFVCSDGGCSGGGRKGNALLPKPKLRSGPIDPEEFPAEDGTAGFVRTGSEEKAELMSHELKQERKNSLDEVLKKRIEAEIPAHYKRHFNQHGYGTKVMAPLATMDEFDHSLRSSMNSLWSQHLHRQEVDSLYGEDDEECELEGDAMSFQSALVN